MIDPATLAMVLSKVIPKCTQHNNLYPQMLHTFEYALNYLGHDDLETLLDATFCSELFKKS